MIYPGYSEKSNDIGSKAFEIRDKDIKLDSILKDFEFGENKRKNSHHLKDPHQAKKEQEDSKVFKLS